MPPLIDLLPGTRFRQRALSLTGTLLKVNDCRALVRLDQPSQVVEFTGPDGAARTFSARRHHETSWAPTVVVEVLSLSRLDESENAMATKTTKTATNATSRSSAKHSKATTAAEPTKKSKPAPARKETQPANRMSILEAAAKVLSESSEPMTTRAMIEVMGVRGYWTSPAGKTPHATLYAAILREINTKGAESRFTRVDRGQFTLSTATTPAPKTTGRKGARKSRPVDGTPGPQAVSDLFQI